MFSPSFISRRSGLSSAFIFLHLHTLILAQNTCYYRDGDPVDGAVPCGAPGASDQCCSNGAACLSNGLCFLAADSSVNTGYCADRSWTSGDCFQSCTEYPYATLYRCDNNNWCCSQGGNTTSCCNDPDPSQFQLPVNTPGTIYNGTAWQTGVTLVSVSSTASSTSGLASSTISPMPAGSSQCPKNETATGCQDCTAAKRRIGLGAGLGTGIPLLILIIVLSMLLIRPRHRPGSKGGFSRVTHNSGYSDMYSSPPSGKAPMHSRTDTLSAQFAATELSSDLSGRQSELSAENRGAELSGVR